MTSHRSRDFSSLSSSSPTSPGASFSRRRERSCSPSSRHGCSPTLTSRHSFSTPSLPRYGGSAYPMVSYNKRLLTPLNLDFDPSIQAIRAKEKDEIKMLNNQFAALIGKVQSLEQHNQVLLTRWNFLREQDNSLSDLDIKLLYDQYMNKLRQQIRSIDAEKEQLDLELDEVLEAMDSFRSKYEDEINKRSAMEFTFMTLKKDLDNGFLHKTELEAKLNGLHAMAELMQTIYDQELEEAMSQIKDVSIVLGIDSTRSNIDPHRIVEDVRAQYEALAIRSWEELEALTRNKLHEGELQSAKYGDHLLNDRRIIAELNIQIQKMRSCILSLKSQCLRLEGTIKEVGTQGEAALNDARAKLANLEEALQTLRQDLAHLVKEYQDLMNIKLALDIEILTYRELMEGEEISMESPAFAFISRIYSGPKFSSSHSSITTTSNMASRAREDSTDRMSRSRGSLESGLSRSQSGGTGGDSGGDFSRSHSNASGGAPNALRHHSTTSRGTLESSLSRSPSSRSGNFADVENTTESSISRSHGSGSFSQPDAYSNRSRDNLEGSLSRSQSNRSGGLSDSVFARTSSGASEGVSEGSLSRSHSGTSASFVEGGLSRSQSNENEELARLNVLRTNSAEDGGVPVGGILRSPSRASTGSSEGRLSRSQSDRNEPLHSHESEGYVETTVSRTNSAEDGGVPVGGISRRHSGASAGSSEGRLSRSQSDRNETLHSHESEGYVETTISRTNSAEDGGVPVGGISRRHSGASAGSSEGRLSRSQSDRNETLHSHESEGYVETTISRTNSAEDGGVPVGGISRRRSRASTGSSEGRLSRSQSDRNETLRSHESEGYVETTGSRTNSAEDGGVPVGGISRSHSEVSRYRSEGSFLRSQSDGVGSMSSCRRERSVESPVFRTNTAKDYRVPVGVIPRSQSEVSRYNPERSLPRCHSGENEARSNHKKEAYAEPTVYRTSSSGGDGASMSGISRSHSGAARDILEGHLSRSLRDQSVGNVGTVLPRARSEGTQDGSLSRSQSDNNATSVESGISRSHSDTARGISAGGGFRTPSITSAALTDSVFIATPCTADEHVHEEMLSRVPSGATESIPEAGLSRSQGGDSEGPVETSTPICYSSRNDDAMERSLSSSHSGESRSFRTADFSRSPSEASRGVSEAGLSRSFSKENDPIAEGKLSRNDSYVTAVSHQDVSRTYSSEAESPSGGIEAPVGSPADGNETIPQRGLGGSYSHEEGLSGVPSGSAYLVDEVHSDNLHYCPTKEASYYGEFSTKE